MNIFSGFVEKIETYIKNEIELIKLDIEERIANLFAKIVFIFLILFSICLALVLLSIGLSLWLNSLFCSTFLGFFVVALVYILLSVIIYNFRNHPIFQSFIHKNSINKVNNAE